MSFTFKLEGDLAGDLANLDQAIQTHVTRSAAYAGAEVLYDEARLHARRYRGSPRPGIKPGQLQDAIYHAHSPELSGPHNQNYKVSWNWRKAPHAGLIENGHWRVNVLARRGNRWVATTDRLATPVWVKAYPFIRKAGDAAPRALEAMRRRARERLAEILAGAPVGGGPA